MKMMKLVKSGIGHSSIVLNTSHERLIHRFNGTGTTSVVETVAIVNGKPFGSSKVYTVNHAANATPNEVFKFLCLDQFVNIP